MILPTKHLELSDSLLGGGSIVLSHLSRGSTISALWEKVRKESEVGNFKRYTLILDFLYTIGAIEISENMIRKGRKS